MAFQHYYVDPAAGSDVSGVGSLVNPWATPQHAIDTIGGPESGGTQVNVRDSAPTVLTGTPLTCSWPPEDDKPLIIRGYTDAANDGGKFELDADGLSKAIDWTVGNREYIGVIDGKIHNSAANYIIHSYRRSLYLGCEIYNAQNQGIQTTSGDSFIGCYFHDITDNANGVQGNSTRFLYNFFDNRHGASSSDNMINLQSRCHFIGNIIEHRGNSDAVQNWSDECLCMNNIIRGPGPSGGDAGIQIQYAGNQQTIANNIIENFTTGIENALNESPFVLAGNVIFGCSVTVSGSSSALFDDAATLVPSESILMDPDNGDYRVKPVYRGSGWPSTYYGLTGLSSVFDRGAVQADDQIVGRIIKGIL